MKTMQRITYVIATAFVALLALPKAIGLTLLYYVDGISRSQLGEGPPSDLKSLHEAMEKAFKTMQENITRVQDTATKALEEVKQEGTIHAKTNEELKKLGEAGTKLQADYAELKARTAEVEQQLVKKSNDGPQEQPKSCGQIVAESEEYKAAQANKTAERMHKVDVGSFRRKATITGQLNQGTTTTSVLVQPDFRPGIVMPGLQRMTVRDLLAQNTTNSNLITYAKELLYTSNAGPQYQASPELTEGALKSESSLTFELANAPVVTIAHWIPASKQILDDAGMLMGYIDGRLRYGLELEEEDELLNADGTAGTLNGLVNQSTAYNRHVTGDTPLDTLLRAQLQVSLSQYDATGYILNPIDWVEILLLKDTTGRYLFSDPHGITSPRVWGKDVVPTQSMTAGKFMAGAFKLAAEIFDRMNATVEISRENADNFVRNLITILAEERLALAVYRSQAIVYGDL